MPSPLTPFQRPWSYWPGGRHRARALLLASSAAGWAPSDVEKVWLLLGSPFFKVESMGRPSSREGRLPTPRRGLGRGSSDFPEGSGPEPRRRGPESSFCPGAPQRDDEPSDFPVGSGPGSNAWGIVPPPGLGPGSYGRWPGFPVGPGGKPREWFLFHALVGRWPAANHTTRC